MRFTNRSLGLRSLAVVAALSSGAFGCRQLQRVREDRFETVSRESLQREATLRVPVSARAATIPLPGAPRMIITRSGVSFNNALQMFRWDAEARARAVASLRLAELESYPIDRPSVITARDSVPNPEQVRGGASGFVLVPLQSAVEHATQLSDAYHRLVSDEPADEVTVVVAVEEDVAFRLVYSALFTAGQARVQRFVFAVRDAATGALRGFEYHLPTMGDRRVFEVNRAHTAPRVSANAERTDSSALAALLGNSAFAAPTNADASAPRTPTAHRAPRESTALVQPSAPEAIPTLRTVLHPSARMHVTPAGVTMLWGGYALAPDCVTLTERTPSSITIAREANAGAVDENAIAQCVSAALIAAQHNPNQPPANVVVTGDPSVAFGAMLRVAMAVRQRESSRERAEDSSMAFDYVDFGLGN